MKRIVSICLGLMIGLVSFAAAQDIPKEIKGGMLNGKATALPRPEYPVEARAAGLEGTVLVDVVIDEAGTVFSAIAVTDARKIKVRHADGTFVETEVQPADPSLREAAEKAALDAKFSPTQLNGVPVKVSGTISYDFVLRTSTSDVQGGVLNGRAISLPMPAYPEAARAVRAAGTVTVKITVDENGDVISAAAASGHPLLRATAVDAARAARFSPTLLSGQPVKVLGVLVYNFVP